MTTFKENPIMAANEQYDEIIDKEAAAALAIQRIKELLEQLLSMPFTAQENGLGEEERTLAEGVIWAELKAITGARNTCFLCGELYTPNDGHDCFDRPYEVA